MEKTSNHEDYEREVDKAAREYLRRSPGQDEAAQRELADDIAATAGVDVKDLRGAVASLNRMTN